MNIQENHLISAEEFKRLQEKGLHKAYIAVPDSLDRAAKAKLNGEPEAKVSFKSGGKLSEWAKKVRKNNGINENEPDGNLSE